MNVTCIDLTMYNHEKLSILAKQLGLIPEELSQNKKAGFAKLYLDSTTLKIFAFTRKNSKNKIEMMSDFVVSLQELKPIEVTKPTEPKGVVKTLTLDSILDKISTSGIESLTLIEKKFLDGLNS